MRVVGQRATIVYTSATLNVIERRGRWCVVSRAGKFIAIHRFRQLSAARRFANRMRVEHIDAHVRRWRS